MIMSEKRQSVTTGQYRHLHYLLLLLLRQAAAAAPAAQSRTRSSERACEISFNICIYYLLYYCKTNVASSSPSLYLLASTITTSKVQITISSEREQKKERGSKPRTGEGVSAVAAKHLPLLRKSAAAAKHLPLLRKSAATAKHLPLLRKSAAATKHVRRRRSKS